METPRIDKINKEIDHYKHPINCYNIIRCCECDWEKISLTRPVISFLTIG
jgi:hypothetical protein